MILCCTIFRAIACTAWIDFNCQLGNHVSNSWNLTLCLKVEVEWNVNILLWTHQQNFHYKLISSSQSTQAKHTRIVSQSFSAFDKRSMYLLFHFSLFCIEGIDSLTTYGSNSAVCILIAIMYGRFIPTEFLFLTRVGEVSIWEFIFSIGEFEFK